jgi:ubiquitin carboxyl-terminal hydrolase 14
LSTRRLVKVKWGKELFDSIELNTDEEPALFKAQLFALTGVSVERQKVMFKGKQIVQDWSGFAFKDGITLLMMGTVDAIPSVPVEKTVFMEDLSENRLAELLDLPAGLENLGNTCYLNATIQCLKTVPELRQSLQKFSGNVIALSNPINTSQLLTAAIRELYNSMDKSATVAPQMLVPILHMAVPRFAEKGEGGVSMQQDANECWSELMSMLKTELKPLSGDQAVGDSGETKGAPKYSNFIDQYFGGTFDVTLKCSESAEETPSYSKESFLQLSCFINTDVKYLQSGLKARLLETLTKFSPTLNRDAQYSRASKISRLPAYLSVQMVRFYYKERESINAKILKDIKFTLVLDVFELCSEELQQKLLPMRSKFKVQEDLKVNQVVKTVESAKSEPEKKKSTYKYPYHFEDDLGSNNSGFYELQGVVTHKGRSSSSGHYVGWIRRNKGTRISERHFYNYRLIIN